MSMSTVYPPPPSISMMGGPNSSDKKRKRPPNTGSQLLSNQENQFLFQLLGPDNVSLSAAVVELLLARNRTWQRKGRGVVSLVKDYRNRAYFIRLFDLENGEKTWEFQLYPNFGAAANNNCPRLLTFEGDRDGQVYGLNFADAGEAERFKQHLDKRRQQEQKTPVPSNVIGRDPRPVAPATPQFGSVGRSAPPPVSNGVTPIGTVVHTEKNPTMTSSGGLLASLKPKKKKEKAKKIRKEDISNPTNFQHKAHVGWDQDNGFSQTVHDEEMDESVKNIIRAAGKDPNNMSKKTIKFVYDFIGKYEKTGITDADVGPIAESTPQSHYGSSSISISRPTVPASQPISQWSTPVAPPPPSRTASHQSSAPPSRPPPPPPSYGNGGSSSRMASKPLPQVPPEMSRPSGVPPPPPPPPPPASSVSTNAPPAPPPPPPTLLSSNAPPAPPPPPSVSGLPPPQQGRGNLLAEIQAGKSLRSVNASPNSSTGGSSSNNSRDDVMAQIRQGAQLKHVDTAAEQEKRKSNALQEMGGLAGALARALEERRINMGESDSSDDDADSDEKNEWSD